MDYWILHCQTFSCHKVIKIISNVKWVPVLHFSQKSWRPTYLSYFWLTLFWLSKTRGLRERVGSKESERNAALWFESILDSLTHLNRFFRINKRIAHWKLFAQINPLNRKVFDATYCWMIVSYGLMNAFWKPKHC